MIQCEELIQEMCEAHTTSYIGYLSKQLRTSLNRFSQELVASLNAAKAELKESRQASRAAFQLKRLIDAVDLVTAQFKKQMRESNTSKELDRMQRNFQENRKLFTFIPSQKRTDLFLFSVDKSKIDKIGLSDLKGLTGYAALGIVDKNILISGGQNEAQESVADTLLLSMQTSKGHLRATMLEPRCFHTLAQVCGSTVYAIGGNRMSNYGTIYLKSCERYQIKGNVWTSLPPLSERKSGVAICVFDERHLYCYGGYRCEWASRRLATATLSCTAAVPTSSSGSGPSTFTTCATGSMRG